VPQCQYPVRRFSEIAPFEPPGVDMSTRIALLKPLDGSRATTA
jgi:hypothetical protein